jgi:hypothetical protein
MATHEHLGATPGRLLLLACAIGEHDAKAGIEDHHIAVALPDVLGELE